MIMTRTISHIQDERQTHARSRKQEEDTGTGYKQTEHTFSHATNRIIQTQ
mgnify:CR=1 FL=1